MIRKGTCVGVRDRSGKELCVGDLVRVSDGASQLEGVVCYDRGRTEFYIDAAVPVRLGDIPAARLSLVNRNAPKMFELALSAQSACNLGAVVHSLDAIVDHLQAVAWDSSKGTDWINQHPAVRLICEQLSYLSGGRTYDEAYAICRVHAPEYLAADSSEPPLDSQDYAAISDPEFKLTPPEAADGSTT